VEQPGVFICKFAPNPVHGSGHRHRLARKGYKAPGMGLAITKQDHDFFFSSTSPDE
jgi:hypothetical protein